MPKILDGVVEFTVFLAVMEVQLVFSLACSNCPGQRKFFAFADIHQWTLSVCVWRAWCAFASPAFRCAYCYELNPARKQMPTIHDSSVGDASQQQQTSPEAEANLDAASAAAACTPSHSASAGLANDASGELPVPNEENVTKLPPDSPDSTPLEAAASTTDES